MKILICDDEIYVREETRDTVLSACPQAECFDTGDVQEALEYVKTSHPDIVLLDIEMPQMDGLCMARKIKQLSAHTNIIFVTAYSQYAVDAFSMYVSGYLLKPLTEDAVRKAFANLRQPVLQEEQKLVVRCFGNFEVFYQGKPLMFARTRAKEVFAYLVDLRGASANTTELCAVLWEDSADAQRNKHYLRNLLSDIRKTLSSIGMEDAFVTMRNSFSVNPERLECDYYRFLENDPVARGEYHGEYMKQYSWAEFSFKL
ncbi:MAG: response regulator [Wujia sp.]